jgi:hypothetical protein
MDSIAEPPKTKGRQQVSRRPYKNDNTLSLANYVKNCPRF